VKYGKRILAAAVVIFFSFLCLELAAEEMPDRAPEELAKILRQDQFQPRSIRSSLLTKVWQAVRDVILSKAKEIWDSIRDIKFPLPEVELPSGWMETLKNILEGVVAALKAVGAFLYACLSYSVYLLCFAGLLFLLWFACKFLQKRAKNFGDSGSLLRAASTQDLAEEIPPLEKLLGEKKYLEAVAALKTIWRRRFTGQYAFSASMTDRSMSRQLPEFEKAKSFFREVVTCFERYVFAGEAVEEEVVKDLYQQNQDLLKENL